MQGADFTGAILNKANLVGANLRGARFVRAYLNEANLSGADLREVNFEGAEFDSVSQSTMMFYSRLRVEPDVNLDKDKVDHMIEQWSFFDAGSNPSSPGCPNVYKSTANDSIIVDQITGLFWQRSGSDEGMNYDQVEQYIRDLNKKRFGGFGDWRLPTLEEAMSLMEPERKNGGLHIDPIFDSKQRWIWTSDKYSTGAAWVVSFYVGYCYFLDVPYVIHVRAVRRGQSSSI